MLHDKDGNKLVRRLEVTVIFPEGIFPPKVMRYKAEPKKGISSQGIDDTLDQISDDLEAKFPWWDFKLVPLSSRPREARYNIVCVGYRENYQPPKSEVADVPTAPAV